MDQYKLDFLPIARQDLIDIVTYISDELKNNIAAMKLAEKFTTSVEKLIDFPYSCPIHVPIKPLNFEYRKLIVDNYIMFYWVDEAKKTVTVARVIYGKRDYEKLL